MDLESILNLVGKINNRNYTANRFYSFYKNTNLLFNKYFLYYFLIILFSIVFLLSNIKRELFDLIFVDKAITVILKSIISVLSVFPFLILIINFFSFRNYFYDSLNKLKYEVLSKKFKNVFSETRKNLKKLYLERIKFYFIEKFFPLIFTVLCTYYLYYFSYEILVIIIIFLFFYSFIMGHHCNKLYSISFYIYNIYNEFPEEKIKQRELISIDNTSIYIDNNERSIILFDQKYLDIRIKYSKFDTTDTLMLITYYNEKINYLKNRVDFIEKSEKEDILKEINSYQEKIDYNKQFI